jgi:hypothetical protein
MTYRTGNHWGVTIVRDGVPLGENGATVGDQLVAVVVNGDQVLAERICTLLNEGRLVDDALDLLRYALHLRQHGERAPGGNETWRAFDRRCEAFLCAADGPGCICDGSGRTCPRHGAVI